MLYILYSMNALALEVRYRLFPLFTLVAKSFDYLLKRTKLLNYVIKFTLDFIGLRIVISLSHVFGNMKIISKQ